MADFCQKCADELGFPPDLTIKELDIPVGHESQELCEGCGIIFVMNIKGKEIIQRLGMEETKKVIEGKKVKRPTPTKSITCEHKWVFKYSHSSENSTGYASEWKRVDEYFCEKCLDEKQKEKYILSRGKPAWYKGN